jgi:hypothetical protein
LKSTFVWSEVNFLVKKRTFFGHPYVGLNNSGLDLWHEM